MEKHSPRIPEKDRAQFRTGRTDMVTGYHIPGSTELLKRLSLLDFAAVPDMYDLIDRIEAYAHGLNEFTDIPDESEQPQQHQDDTVADAAPVPLRDK